MALKSNSLIKPIIVLVLICLVASFLLAGVFQLTDPIIKEREAETMANALSSVLPKASSFTKLENIKLEESVTEVYEADNGSGIVCTTECKSKQGGKIKMMIGIDSFGQLNGISVINHNETAGLGDKALAEDYLKNYYGISSINDITSVDALSGVTKTSNCVKDSCKTAINQFINYSKNSNPSMEKTTEEKLAAARVEFFPDVDSFTKLTVELDEGIDSVYQAADNKGYLFYLISNNFDGLSAAIAIDNNGSCSEVKIIEYGSALERIGEFSDEELSMFKDGLFETQNEKQTILYNFTKKALEQYKKLTQ